MILVTGATGLVGSHLLLHLVEAGYQVRGIFREQKNIAKTKNLFSLYNKLSLFENIEWMHADLNDLPSLEDAFQNVTEVYHCAALISFNPDDHEKLRKVNIEGTANIVNFCLGHNVRKLCHVSSIAALGDLKEHESVITEAMEWNPEKPHNDYSITKYGAEMEIWRGQQEGLNAVIVNPGIILGAGFWGDGSGEFFSRVQNGLKFYTLGTAGFVDVWDVVTLMKILMESDLSAERFTIVAETLSFRDVLIEISTALKVSPPSIYAKPYMTSLAWKVDWLLSKIGFRRNLTQDDVRALHSTTIMSNEKIREKTGFEFTPIKKSIHSIVRVQKSAS